MTQMLRGRKNCLRLCPLHAASFQRMCQHRPYRILLYVDHDSLSSNSNTSIKPILKKHSPAMMDNRPRASSSTERRAMLSGASTQRPLASRSTSYNSAASMTPRGSPTIRGSPVFSTRHRGNSNPSFLLPPASLSTLNNPRSRTSKKKPQGYKGFESEEAYLDALKEWAEEKKYIQPSDEATMLTGFYGAKTINDYNGVDKEKKKNQSHVKKHSRESEEAEQHADNVDDHSQRGGHSLLRKIWKRKARKDDVTTT